MGPVFQQRQHLTCGSSSNLLAQHDVGRQRRRLPSHMTYAAVPSVMHTPAAADSRTAPVSLQALLSGGARVTEAAQAVWAGLIVAGDTVMDATCGNGHDTLALARLVGPSGCIVALDIQAEAVDSTRQHLQRQVPADQMPVLRLVNACHSQLQEVLSREGIRAPQLVCFNLGWMPNQPSGSKEIKTERSTTLEALQQAHAVVAAGGSVSVVAYTGHEGGMEEYECVRDYMAGLDRQSWVTTETRLLNRGTAPRLLLSHRMSGRSAGQPWQPNVAFAT